MAWGRYGRGQVEQALVECDCGEIPVVDSLESMRPVGVITDRDIVCRAIAAGHDVGQATAEDCMTSPAIIVTPQTDLAECLRLMEDNQIRRVPVVDDTGRCCGIVSQADIALRASRKDTARVVSEVSRDRDEGPRATH